MLTRIALVLGFGVICLRPAGACFWDSDTLAQEAAGLPGVVEALVGFYPRNPPRYYEMRLERVLPLIEERPSDLELYDDAAVALDRLGRPGEAIGVMARKREALDRLAQDDPDRVEHEYRYLANLGTHHAHRWLASEDREEDLSDLQRARDLIAAAIELNPDAHFGREFVQLRVLGALLAWREPSASRSSDYDDVLDLLVPRPPRGMPHEEYDKTLEGFIGLVMLGQAGQSVDIHLALGRVVSRRVPLTEAASSLGQLATMRATELHDDGRRSLFLPSHDPGEVDKVDVYVRHALHRRQWEQNAAFFTDARRAAEDAHAARVRYMQERFDRGEHPDTHPDFWAAHEQAELPAMPDDGSVTNAGRIRRAVIAGAVVLLVGLGGVAGGVWWAWRWLSRRRAGRRSAAV